MKSHQLSMSDSSSFDLLNVPLEGVISAATAQLGDTNNNSPLAKDLSATVTESVEEVGNETETTGNSQIDTSRTETENAQKGDPQIDNSLTKNIHMDDTQTNNSRASSGRAGNSDVQENGKTKRRSTASASSSRKSGKPSRSGKQNRSALKSDDGEGDENGIDADNSLVDNLDNSQKVNAPEISMTSTPQAKSSLGKKKMSTPKMTPKTPATPTNSSIEISENGEKIHRCDLCSQTFKRPYYLTKHLEKHAQSTEIKSHECSLCPKKFGSPVGLRVHVKRVHYHSDTCDSSAEATHSSHHCQLCPKAFKEITAYKKHMLHVHKALDANGVNASVPGPMSPNVNDAIGAPGDGLVQSNSEVEDLEDVTNDNATNNPEEIMT